MWMDGREKKALRNTLMPPNPADNTLIDKGPGQ